jgi:hypothetical protein
VAAERCETRWIACRVARGSSDEDWLPRKVAVKWVSPAKVKAVIRIRAGLWAGFVFDLEEEVADLDRGSFREILKAQREGFHGRRKAHGVGPVGAYREDFRPHVPLAGGAPLVEQTDLPVLSWH